MQSLTDDRSDFEGKRGHLTTVKVLLPYLWPKNAREMRIRVVVALIFLIAAKAITVAVPIIYKLAVDKITNTGDAIVIVPIFLLIAYGGARVLAQTFGELRDAVFAKVAQRAIREAGLKPFGICINSPCAFISTARQVDLVAPWSGALKASISC